MQVLIREMAQFDQSKLFVRLICGKINKEVKEMGERMDLDARPV